MIKEWALFSILCVSGAGNIFLLKGTVGGEIRAEEVEKRVLPPETSSVFASLRRQRSAKKERERKGEDTEVEVVYLPEKLAALTLPSKIFHAPGVLPDQYKTVLALTKAEEGEVDRVLGKGFEKLQGLEREYARVTENEKGDYLEIQIPDVRANALKEWLEREATELLGNTRGAFLYSIVKNAELFGGLENPYKLALMDGPNNELLIEVKRKGSGSKLISVSHPYAFAEEQFGHLLDLREERKKPND